MLPVLAGSLWSSLQHPDGRGGQQGLAVGRPWPIPGWTCLGEWVCTAMSVLLQLGRELCPRTKDTPAHPQRLVTVEAPRREFSVEQTTWNDAGALSSAQSGPRASAPGGCCKNQVQDQGCGLAAQHQTGRVRS